MILITNRLIKLSFLDKDDVTIPPGTVIDCKGYLKTVRGSYSVITAPAEYKGYTVRTNSGFLDEIGWIRIPTKTHGSLIKCAHT